MNEILLNDDALRLILRQREGEWWAIIDGKSMPFRWERIAEHKLFVNLGGVKETITLVAHDGGYFLHGYGRTWHARVDNPLTRTDTGDAGDESLSVAPMPGTVVSVAVSKGDRVEKGALLLTIESMKMLTDITAGRDGTVAELFVGEGEVFDKGAKLVLLE